MEAWATQQQQQKNETKVKEEKNRTLNTVTTNITISSKNRMYIKYVKGEEKLRTQKTTEKNHW